MAVVRMQNGEFKHAELELIQAAIDGNTEKIKDLVNEKFPPNLNIRYGDFKQTPLMWALQYERIEAAEVLAKSLINAAADLDAKDEGKGTALMYAASSGYTKIVNLLIDAGADINAKNLSERTALSMAATGRHDTIVKILINAGADISVFSQEQKQKYKELLPQDDAPQPLTPSDTQPYSMVNDYTVSKYEGEVQGLGHMRQVFNFQARTIEKYIDQTLSAEKDFDDMTSPAARNVVKQAYKFMKAAGKGKNIPAPFRGFKKLGKNSRKKPYKRAR